MGEKTRQHQGNRITKPAEAFAAPRVASPLWAAADCMSIRCICFLFRFVLARRKLSPRGTPPALPQILFIVRHAAALRDPDGCCSGIGHRSSAPLPVTSNTASRSPVGAVMDFKRLSKSLLEMNIHLWPRPSGPLRAGGHGFILHRANREGHESVFHTRGCMCTCG